MSAEKYPVRLPHQATVGEDGTGYVRSDVLSFGQVLDCQSIAFRNRTDTRGDVELYIKQGASLTFICDQTAPAAGRWYWYPYTQTIKEGEQIEAQQALCIAGDILDLHIIGHITFESIKQDKPAVSPAREAAPGRPRAARVVPVFHPGRSKSPGTYEV
ncbi:hypothetical protein ES703_46318 [subsurface metagenome]